jgi:diguanylate cyclase (GGDEF)-like protein
MHDAQTTVRRVERSDPLTGVLGRQPFVLELEQLGRRSQDLIGVLLVSVEGLAELNEANGFGAGDALLQAVGSRLGSVVRGRDVVGRCSGNRFAVACSSVRDANALEQFAERVSRMLSEPVVTSAGVVPVQIRVATALRSRKGGDAAAVLLDAERLLAAPAEDTTEPETVRENVPGNGAGNEHGKT